MSLLITIDEAQVLGDSLKPLAAVMQMVTKRHQQPVAWALAGTREFGQLLLRSGSFSERMARAELQMLTREQSRLALIEPANDQGVTWDDSSARIIADAAGGYPCFVQLGRFEAWRAEPRETAIGESAAQKAVSEIANAAERMFGDRWSRLSPMERRYLAVAAVLALDRDPAGMSTGEIARVLGRSTPELSMTRQALIDEHRLLQSGEYGHIRFAIPRFELWLQQHLAGEPRDRRFADLLSATVTPPTSLALDATRLAQTTEPQPVRYALGSRTADASKTRPPNQPRRDPTNRSER